MDLRSTLKPETLFATWADLVSINSFNPQDPGGPEKALWPNTACTFGRVAGDRGMIQRLVNGQRDEMEFRVVRPGHRVTASYDDRDISTEAVTP